jgi:hypothetical protein
VINVADVVNDPDVAQSFTILRDSGGAYVNGVWTPGAPTTIPAYGPIRPATDRDIESLPEGDRIKEVKTFWSSQPMYGTRATAGVGRSSDILTWLGLLYRVMSVAQSQDYGFYRAVAVRMKGN